MPDNADPLSGSQRAMIVAGLREAGCDCEPNIVQRGPVARGVVTDVTIQHDDWCALLRKVTH